MHNVKVGLTISAAWTPNPDAIPCVNRVFPLPNVPSRARTIPGVKYLPINVPNSMVSASDDVTAEY
jgi:hypothetical protein